MNEVGKEFLQCWDEFKAAVLNTIPQPSKCEDPVAILKYSGREKLTPDQIDKLEMLSNIHTLIERCMERDNIGVEEVISTCLGPDHIDYLKRIMVSI